VIRGIAYVDVASAAGGTVDGDERGVSKAPGLENEVPATQLEEQVLTPAPPTFAPKARRKFPEGPNFSMRWLAASAT